MVSEGAALQNPFVINYHSLYYYPLVCRMMSYKKCLARGERDRQRERERETDRQIETEIERERERESLWIQLSLTPTDTITLVFVFVLRPYEVRLSGLET